MKPSEFEVPSDPPEGANRYSRKYKSWRERYTALCFLECLGEDFDPIAVRCYPGDATPDVVYRDSRFEVKEVLDAGRKPHEETKRHLELEASLGRRILREAAPARAVYPEGIGQLLLERLSLLKYRPSERSTLDMLFYCNRWQEQLHPGMLTHSDLFAQFQFRSVSAVVEERVSLVFYTGTHAPTFLQQKVGRYCERSRPPA